MIWGSYWHFYSVPLISSPVCTLMTSFFEYSLLYSSSRVFLDTFACLALLPHSVVVLIGRVLYLQIDLEIFDVFLRFKLLLKNRGYIHFLLFKSSFASLKNILKFFHKDLPHFLLHLALGFLSFFLLL